MSFLPGLYLALLAFLLAGALRRWWDPVPLRIWAVFGLVLLILFGPALFLGRVLLPVDLLPGVAPPESLEAPPRSNVLQTDLVTQIVPWQAQVRRAVKAGAWPMWNDLAGAGMPLLADPQSQWLQPLVLVALPLPLPQAVGVTAGLRVLTALVFFFLLLRRQGLSEAPALFGALAYGLGGFLLLWLNWPLGNSPALLPLVLYALVMTAERGGGRDFMLLVLAVVSLLTGGHPETIVHIALVGSFFAAARLLRQPAGQRPGLLVRWALAGAMALALAAPAWVPARRFLPQTHRSQLVEMRNQRMGRLSAAADGRTSERRKVVQSFVPVVAPNAYGNSRWGVYWGRSNSNEDAGGFVGGAALLAALLAFVPTAGRFPQERLFLALAPLCLLIILGLPGIARLLSALPVLNQSVTANRRLLLVLGFSLSYLAACTVERWWSGRGPGRPAVLACAAVLLGLVAWGYLSSPEVEALLTARRFWMGLQLAVVSIGASLLALRRSVWLLIILAVVELLVIHRPANPSLPRDRYYPQTPAIEFLQKHAGGFRIAGLGDRLLPNAAGIYGLADVRISSPFKPFAYSQAVAPVSVSVRSVEHILVRAEHPVYQLLGARYVLAPPKMKSAPGWRAVFRDPTGRIFERTRVLPRLFLPQSAATPGAGSWTAWVAANPDFAARSLILPADGHAENWGAARPGESTLEILALEPARITARVLLAEDRLLATSVYQDGGWTVLLDGRPHPALAANGPFLAAWLPAGERRLELLYRAPGLVPGLLLAAAALAGLAAWLWPPARLVPGEPFEIHP